MQIFSIDCIPKPCKTIKIVIRETFGASNTYMNKLLLMEKCPRLEKKGKNDESIVNISDITNYSHELWKNHEFPRNPKSKLKLQLEDLSFVIKNMEDKYKSNEKGDEIEEIKEEVQH